MEEVRHGEEGAVTNLSTFFRSRNQSQALVTTLAKNYNCNCSAVIRREWVSNIFEKNKHILFRYRLLLKKMLIKIRIWHTLLTGVMLATVGWCFESSHTTS